MRLHICHHTAYTYDVPVQHSIVELRQQPEDGRGQQRLTFGLTVAPFAQVTESRDAFGNTVHRIDLPAPHTTLTITAESRVDTEPPPALAAVLPDAWAAIDAQRETLAPYLSTSLYTDGPLAALAADLGVSGRAADPCTTLRQLLHAAHTALDYQRGVTEADSPLSAVLERRAGVCQDFAHLLIALGRRLGLPCRYVSGYRLRYDAPHAWVESWLPGVGWIGIDPTHNTFAGAEHVRIAVGRDAADVRPTQGCYLGRAAHRITVTVTVREETPGQ